MRPMTSLSAAIATIFSIAKSTQKASVPTGAPRTLVPAWVKGIEVGIPAARTAASGCSNRRLRKVRPKADTFGVFEAALKDRRIEEVPALVGGGSSGRWAKAMDVIGIGEYKAICIFALELLKKPVDCEAVAKRTPRASLTAADCVEYLRAPNSILVEHDARCFAEEQPPEGK